MGPYEMNNWINSKKDFSTAIIANVTGTFSLAGSMPIELTKEIRSGFSTVRVSKSFATEEEVISALLNIGRTDFQLSDCSWYKQTTN